MLTKETILWILKCGEEAYVHASMQERMKLNKFCVRWMVANFQLIDTVFENHKRINEYKMSDKMIWVAFVDALKKFLV